MSKGLFSVINGNYKKEVISMACISIVFNDRTAESEVDAFCKEIKTLFVARYQEWKVECRGPFYHPREIPPSVSVCVDDAHVGVLLKALDEFLCEDPRANDLIAGMRLDETNGRREEDD